MKTNFFLVAFFFLLFFSCATSVSAVSITDTDQDGISDQEEKELYFTDPNKSDTDGDGFSDLREIQSDYSPHKASSTRLSSNDYDGDGLNDWTEVKWFGSSMGKLDTDSDGVSDFDEVMKGSKPAVFGTSSVLTREVVVDRTSQQMFYYVDKIKVKTFPVSTGNPQTPTPAGSFSIQRKLPFIDYIGPDYNFPRTPWNMQFKPRYYIHTAYWHNDFGIRTRSHGCINMKKEDAALLYKYVDVGLSVTVTGTTPVGRYVKR